MGALVGLNRILGRLTGFWVVCLDFGWFAWFLGGLGGFWLDSYFRISGVLVILGPCLGPSLGS